MEFEVLKKGHIKRNIIIGVIAVLLISAVILNFTRAKYRTTADIPIASGTINYSLADLNIVGLYIDGEEATELDSSKNYTLDTSRSTCTYKDGSTIDNLTLNYNSETKSFSISPYTTKGTKCTLYFDEQYLLKDAILANAKRGEGTPNFAKTSCSSGCEEATVGLYEEQTSFGTTYYFRGDVEDNYLSFAGYYWRIIRINEDGSVRVIYNGEKSKIDAAGKETVLANGYDDGSTRYTQIQTSAFNSSSNRSEYVGFRYTEGSQRPSNTNSGTESTMKGVLDTWYSNNLQQYDNMLTNTPGFCNDRETASNWVSAGESLFYAARERLRTTPQPSFECNNDNDLYQTKIGLISADEVIYAGGTDNNSNYGYYLYTGNHCWTMSPAYFSGSYALIYYVTFAGDLIYGNVISSYSVRLVINLSFDVAVKSGNGTISSPYEVEHKN